ncbi:hypothetical protein C7M84_022421 [Penaeus vannamei]|uniref:Uncharacterized protein n=1 Tax=Penaeus vannamei TaxID=6689 RepID=A0A423U6S4_PENVA|nr:hypothetical protein C7M84_022421 [Penaeus vannamei]
MTITVSHSGRQEHHDLQWSLSGNLWSPEWVSLYSVTLHENKKSDLIHSTTKAPAWTQVSNTHNKLQWLVSVDRKHERRRVHCKQASAASRASGKRNKSGESRMSNWKQGYGKGGKDGVSASARKESQRRQEICYGDASRQRRRVPTSRLQVWTDLLASFASALSRPRARSPSASLSPLLPPPPPLPSLSLPRPPSLSVLAPPPRRHTHARTHNRAIISTQLMEPKWSHGTRSSKPPAAVATCEYGRESAFVGLRRLRTNVATAGAFREVPHPARFSRRSALGSSIPPPAPASRLPTVSTDGESRSSFSARPPPLARRSGPGRDFPQDGGDGDCGLDGLQMQTPAARLRRSRRTRAPSASLPAVGPRHVCGRQQKLSELSP